VNEHVGAYGMRLLGLPDERWLQPVPPHWPTWSFARRGTSAESQPFSADERRVQIPLLDANSLELDRDAQEIRYLSATDPAAAAWAHPILSPAAMFVGDWAGRLAFHAGAFLDDRGRAWIVFGRRNDGKSTTLAWLAMHGATVLCDDLVITDGATVVTGPRCVDLRPAAALQFGIGELVEESESRERWRVSLPPAPAETPLAGFVELVWTDDQSAPDIVEMADVTARRDSVLSARALLTSQGHARAWLGVLAKPVLRFEREKSWSALDGAMAELRRRTDAHAR
jgi:hypothetical protein